MTARRSLSRGAFRAIMALALSIMFTAPVKPAGTFSPHGFDLIIVVDDSSSMGTRNLTAPRSDSDGRRIVAASYVANRLYQFADWARKGLGENWDFRYSVIRFGSRARLARDWTVLDTSKAPPDIEGLRPINLQWTNFEAAFASVRTQAEKIDFGRIRTGAQRRLIVLLLTDGEPSTKARPEGIWEDSRWWRKFRDRFVGPLTMQNPETEFYIVAFDNPRVDYWPKVRDRWRDARFTGIVVPHGDSNRMLFKILKEGFIDKVLPSPAPIVKDNTFEVPCFQGRAYFNIFFYKGPAPVTLISPDANSPPVFHDRQPGFSGNSMYAQFYVDAPDAGTWHIQNYDMDKFTVSFQTVPFKVTYQYPGPDRTFLKTERRLALALSRADGKPFSEGDKDYCLVEGEIKVREEPGGREHTLSLKIRFEDHVIMAETEAPFAPAPKTTAIEAKVTMRARGSNVIATDWRAFKISDKQPVRLSPHEGTAVYLDGERAQVQIRVGFRDFFAPEQLLRVDDVLAEPDQSLVAEISCPQATCTPWDDIDDTGPQDGPIRVTLEKVDDSHMGADVELRYRPGERPSAWRPLLDSLLNRGAHIEVTLLPVLGAAVGDKILLLGPDGP